jgi:hypothetical protein
MIDDPRYPIGVELFRARSFFEAHEELELVWRATPAGPDKRFLQGLIQLAVSLEHWRRGNPRGALGQWEKGRSKMEGLAEIVHGVELARLLSGFDDYYGRWDLPALVRAQAEGTLIAPTNLDPMPLPEWASPPR